MHSPLSSSTQAQGYFSGANGGLAPFLQNQNQTLNTPTPPILPGPTTLTGGVRPSIAPAAAAALMAAALAAQQRQQQQQYMPRPANSAMTHQPFGIQQTQRQINLPGPTLPFLHNPDHRIESTYEDPQQQGGASSEGEEDAVEEDDDKSPRKRRDGKVI